MATEPTFVTWLPDATGAPRAFAWTSAPLTDGKGAAQGSVRVGRDVTAELERVEGDRKLVLALADATALRSLQEERARFFNVMAHEVNNPLTVLIMQVDLLKEHYLGDLTPQQSKSVEVLDRTLARMRGLMADLLETSRIQSGDLKLRRVEVDIGSLIAESAAAYAPLASKAGVALNVRATREVLVNADPRRVTQVLVNFLSNALKFTPAGGEVEIGVAREGPHVVLRVRDTGRGLAPEQRAALFEPFSQAHADSASKGTGLGLFISRGIAEAHGGSVGCESDGEGKGATFWLKLPLLADGGAAA